MNTTRKAIEPTTTWIANRQTGLNSTGISMNFPHGEANAMKETALVYERLGSVAAFLMAVCGLRGLCGVGGVFSIRRRTSSSLS
jgi:hypothetical protein